MRILLLPPSHTYKFPDISIVIPYGLSKLELNPEPSADPLTPSPAIVEVV